MEPRIAPALPNPELTAAPSPDGPPWLLEARPDISAAPAPRRTAGMMDKAVVALTVVTALCLVLGSRGEPSRSHELLPVMIVTTAR